MKKIGEGISAQVYSDGVYAYKKYHKGYSLDNMVYETRIQNEIYHHTHLNVAKYDIVDDQIRMTLFEGKSLAERIIKEHYTEGLKQFIDLQLQFFEYDNLNLADSYQTFSAQIKESKINGNLKEKALNSISKIEKVYRLCHFDYHPENLMYHHNVPYVIDWTNAKLGNPVMDIASTYIIFRLYADEYAHIYLNAMIENGYKISKIKDALPVMAFIRYRETQDLALRTLLEKFITGTDLIFNYQKKLKV